MTSTKIEFEDEKFFDILEENIESYKKILFAKPSKKTIHNKQKNRNSSKCCVSLFQKVKLFLKKKSHALFIFFQNYFTFLIILIGILYYFYDSNNSKMKSFFSNIKCDSKQYQKNIVKKKL